MIEFHREYIEHLKKSSQGHSHTNKKELARELRHALIKCNYKNIYLISCSQ